SLALRNIGRHGADGVLGPVRSLSKVEDHHPSSGRHDPLLRRARWPRPESAGTAHIGRGLFKNPAVLKAAAHGCSSRFLGRARHVRRWGSGDAVRPGIFWPRSSRVRYRRTARTDCTHDQDCPRPGSASPGATQDFFRQCREAAKQGIHLVARSKRLFLPFSTSAALVTPVKLGGPLAGKLSSELVATSFSLRLARSRSSSIFSRTDFSNFSVRRCFDLVILYSPNGCGHNSDA